jgi:MinD-like ATPase involved in chromosome partitioning or flagellar assembly
MGTIVTIHSFRRGVGKTSIASSLATLLALRGYRVTLVDTDFQSPSAHLFFGLSEGEISHTLNDYLWDRCDVLSATRSVKAKIIPDASGDLFLLPASGKVADIMQSIHIPPDIDCYVNAFEKLERELSLDVILVDAPAGLNENTLQTIALSDAVVLVLHPDKQDFQGTAVTVDTVRRLQIPDIHLVLNDVSDGLDIEDAQRQLEETYRCGAGMILEHSEELMTLSSSRPFVLEYPSHPLTAQLEALSKKLLV